MDLTPYLSSLRQDLATAAQAGDENTRRSATVLAAAIEPAARLALMNALSDMAAEITSELPEHTVDVRLSGRDVKVVVTPVNPAAEPEPEPEPQSRQQSDTTEPSGDMSRMTLRLVEEMKARAEQAAAAQGVSLNSFVQQALQGALGGGSRQRKPNDPAENLRGWAQW